MNGSNKKQKDYSNVVTLFMKIWTFCDIVSALSAFRLSPYPLWRRLKDFGESANLHESKALSE